MEYILKNMRLLKMLIIYYSFITCVRRSAGLYLSELYSRDVDNLSIKIIIDNFPSDI